jgi:glycosyltransferase involved in cell wall biosynthesis
VLHVVQTIASLRASNGGPSRTVVELSRALGRCADTRVSIVTADRCSADELAALKSRLRTPAVSILAPGSVLQRLRALVRGGGPTPAVIHDNGVWLWSNLQAAIGAQALRVPAVISPQGCLEQWSLRQNPWRKRAAMILYQRRCLANAAAFHATSVLEARNVRALGLRQPIAVISNGIESPPAGSAASLATTESPTTPGTLTTPNVALFLSRLHRKKGVLDLLAAWAMLRPQGWMLRIVGPDDDGYRQKVIETIASLGLHDRVELQDEAGNDQKWNHYRQARLFILPTYSENFGLVVGEALACGVPVITTTETPWTEVAARGCGWIVTPGVASLRNALAEATRLPAARLADMGDIGRRWIPAQFSWTTVAERMRLLYSWLSDGAPPTHTPGFVMAE